MSSTSCKQTLNLLRIKNGERTSIIHRDFNNGRKKFYSSGLHKEDNNRGFCFDFVQLLHEILQAPAKKIYKI